MLEQIKNLMQLAAKLVAAGEIEAAELAMEEIQHLESGEIS